MAGEKQCRIKANAVTDAANEVKDATPAHGHEFPQSCSLQQGVHASFKFSCNKSIQRLANQGQGKFAGWYFDGQDAGTNVQAVEGPRY